MKNAYDAVAEAIHAVSRIDLADITPDKHILDDLGVDSLDFLDITFEVDSALGIKLPIEDWLAKAKEEQDTTALVMRNFVKFVEASVHSHQAA